MAGIERTVVAAAVGAVVGASILLLPGCGGDDSPTGPDPQSPMPVLSSVSPASVQAGHADFTLTVEGSGFIAGSTVRWNGLARTTTRVSASRLTAEIGAADVGVPGAAQVTVFTPAPGGGTSQQVSFTIAPPDVPLPVLVSLDPSDAVAGSGTLSLRVLGSDFVAASTIHWNGEARTTEFASSGELVASLPEADLAQADTAWVTVVTPAPGGGSSDPLPFVVRQEGGEGAGWEVALGRDHTCALDPDGSAWCWGWGRGGRLGNGSTLDQSAPVPVSGGHRFQSIVAGEHHSCALTSEGEAWCWGEGSEGRLGDGGSSNRVTPQAVVGGHRFRELGAGYIHTCGIDFDGDTWCWGSNFAGQLGQGTEGGSSLIPVRLTGDVRPASLHIYAAASGSCALDAEGRSWCWGRNPSGVGESLLASPGLVADTPRLVALASSTHWLCGLTADGEAWCWGQSNGWGQLGRGVLGGTAPFEPAPVAGGLHFDRITVGWAHACALTAEGDAWCWGGAQRGRLGNGVDGDPIPAPGAVSGGLRFRSLSAGEHHTCGATLDGEVWCWGRGNNGRLGNGGTGDALVPVRVQFPEASRR